MFRTSIIIIEKTIITDQIQKKTLHHQLNNVKTNIFKGFLLQVSNRSYHFNATVINGILCLF